LVKKYNDAGLIMAIHSVSNKGWVVIPAELRKYGLRPGQRCALWIMAVFSNNPGDGQPVNRLLG
jgi:hypothetical protein